MVSPLVRKIVNKHERDIRLMQRTNSLTLAHGNSHSCEDDP
jgi:hypothetical protein